MIPATPVYFGLEQQLFGWHHIAHGPEKRTTGVLICPPLGKEFMCSYLALRHLGEHFAAAGFSTFRLEYFGTGNSAGLTVDERLVDRWLDDITTAIEELKQRSGCTRVALVGLRMGGTLAACAALNRDDVEAIVFWEPCADGGKFVRQLRIISMTNPLREVIPAEIGLDVAGFRFTPETCEALESLQLTKLRRPTRVRMLLLSRRDRPHDEELADHLRQLGAKVDTGEFAGYSKLMLPAHQSELPIKAISDIVDWLARVGAPRTASAEPRRALTATGRTRLVTECAVRTSNGPNRPITETALRFSSGLFGVLTAPTTPDAGKPAIILLNTGSECHVGPHRVYVPLARDWADQGFAVMRFDIAGVGASPVRAGERENDSFPTSAIDDIKTVLSYLHQRNYHRCVLVGLCSGGYHAVIAAYRKLPVVGVVAFNPWLHYQPPDTVDPILTRLDAGEAARNLFSLKKWSRFFQGKIRYAYVFRAVANQVRLATDRFLPKSLRSSNALDPDQVRAAFVAKLTLRGVPTRVFYSRGDPSHVYFAEVIGDSVDKLVASGDFSVEILDGCDHDFATSRLQTLYIQLLTRSICEFVVRRDLGEVAPETANRPIHGRIAENA